MEEAFIWQLGRMLASCDNPAMSGSFLNVKKPIFGFQSIFLV